MAFQVGSYKISGTVDGLSFYKSVFGWLVRRKGGPGSKQFKTSPAFARSRENSTEFAACSKAASLIRHLVLAHTRVQDKTLYHRLMKLMRRLADYDIYAQRGQRDPLKGIASAKALSHLKDFKITPEWSLYDLLKRSRFLISNRKSEEPKVLRKPIKAGLIRIKRRDRTGFFEVRVKDIMQMPRVRGRPLFTKEECYHAFSLAIYPLCFPSF